MQKDRINYYICECEKHTIEADEDMARLFG